MALSLSQAQGRGASALPSAARAERVVSCGERDRSFLHHPQHAQCTADQRPSITSPHLCSSIQTRAFNPLFFDLLVLIRAGSVALALLHSQPFVSIDVRSAISALTYKDPMALCLVETRPTSKPFAPLRPLS